MTTQQPETITIDGTVHNVADFGEGVQRLVKIRTLWVAQLETERLSAAKSEAAIRGLDAELTSMVAKELVDKAAPAAAAE